MDSKKSSQQKVDTPFWKSYRIWYRKYANARCYRNIYREPEKNT